MLNPMEIWNIVLAMNGDGSLGPDSLWAISTKPTRTLWGQMLF